MEYQKLRRLSIFIVFSLLLLFPLVNGFFSFVPDISSTENRRVSNVPSITINNLDTIPFLYEKYYTDNFTLRQRLMKAYNILNASFLQKSSILNKVVVGKDNWLYLGGSEFDSYTGKNALTEEELFQIQAELTSRSEYLQARGTKLYVCIVPAKSSIYSEYLPKNTYRISKNSWGESVNAYLQKHSKLPVIDIYSPLKNNKKQGLLYSKLDNHWTQKGAFFAAQAIVEVIKSDFPNLSPLNYADYRISNSIVHTGNVSKMISYAISCPDSAFTFTPKAGLHSKEVKKSNYPVVKGFPYPNEYERAFEIPDSQKPSILLISDSFGGKIFPFFNESFSRSVKIFDSWQYKLNEEIVKNEKPDIMLLMILESNIRFMLQYKSFK